MNGRIAPAASALAGLVGFVLLWARPAPAFDSAGPDIQPQTHAQPTPPTPWPFNDTYFQVPVDPSQDTFSALSMTTSAALANGNYNFELQMVRDLVGTGTLPGVDPNAGLFPGSGSTQGANPDVGSIGGVLLCPWAQDPTATGFGDMSQCQPWPTTANQFMPGWAKVHRAWDTRASGDVQNVAAPEHRDIAIASAAFAGLVNLPLFSSTLWLRYPVNGTWLATYVSSKGTLLGLLPTPTGLVLPTLPSGWATAPSWRPVDFSVMGALATRGFRLAELAQLPDVSNAVWDWAAGNEVCPIDGLDTTVLNADGTQSVVSAFGSPANDLNACHDFRGVMGAVNASHFLPLSQSYYHYYHGLALQREAQCLQMSISLAPIYALQTGGPSNGQGTSWATYQSPNDSEVNVCEQEAFTYEMNAQHYLQDAWSTGHMWSRWGYSDLVSFPSGPGSPSDPEASARRMATAAVVGGYAGTIHGAKGISGKLVPLLAIPVINWVLNKGFIDDPLCGPTYYDPAIPQNGSAPVQWSPSGGSPYSGVGDLFYNPFSGANLSMDATNYGEQDKRLLVCGARSLYDVYASGPMSYGPATPSVVQNLAVTDPSLQAGPSFDSYCLGQAATNASMSGSLGAFYLNQKTSSRVRDWVFSLANKVVIDEQLKVVTWPANAAGPWSAFSSYVVNQMGTDIQKLKAVFNARAQIDPKGTATSQLIGGLPGSQLTLLGVPPNSQPANPTQPPSAFADVPTATLSGTPQDAVRRLFWRAHPEDVCSEELVTDPSMRCQAGGPLGGDPEACTACVDLAEMQVPTCTQNYDANGLPTTAPQILNSKCGAMGDQVDTSLLPQAWWNSNARLFTCGAYPNYWLAFFYCTGTSPIPASGGNSATVYPPLASYYGQTLLSSVETPDPTCPPDPNTGEPANPLGVSHMVVANAHAELSATDQTVRPVVVAWNQVLSLVDSPTPCQPYFVNDQDNRIQALYPFSLWQDALRTTPVITPGDETVGVAPYLAVCGLSQRLTYWNRSCGDVLARYGSAMNLGAAVSGGAPDPATGAQILSTSFTDFSGDEERCSVREARTYSTTCPGNMACSTSGLCVPARNANGMPIPGTASPPVVTNLP